MNDKKIKGVFTISKIGYTSGIYGCSNEYFNCIIVSKNKLSGFTFYGMYGSEQRVQATIEKLGFVHQWSGCNTYGKLKRSDIMRVESEYRAIENIGELIRHGYIEDKK